MTKSKTLVTNEQVVQAFQTLRELDGVKMPPLTALKVARLIDALDAEAKRIGAVQNRLLLEYAKRSTDGQPVHPTTLSGELDVTRVTIATEHREIYSKCIAELAEGKVEIEAALLTIEDLTFKGPDGENVRFMPDTFRGLGPFLVEEVELVKP